MKTSGNLWYSMFLAGVIISLWITGATFAASQKSQTVQKGIPFTDNEVVRAIEDKIISDPIVPFQTVRMRCKNGELKLEGTVSSLQAKKHAAAIARTVKGVSSVINNLRVLPLKNPSDKKLKSELEKLLSLNPATSDFEIDVEANNSAVTLTGKVRNINEKGFIESIVSEHGGVTTIKNNIETVTSRHPDSAIEKDLQQLFRRDRLIDDGLLLITSKNGQVKLTGLVGSAAEKARILSHAGIRGVQSVDASELQVGRWARDPELKKDKYRKFKDIDIRRAIEQRLLFSPEIRSRNVIPHVTDGIVTLSGDVAYLEAKHVAAREALAVVGVIDVKNHLRVAVASTPEDRTMLEDITTTFEIDPFLGSQTLETKVTNGVLTIRGEVPGQFEKLRAEAVAGKIKGITEIKNELKPLIETPVIYHPYIFNRYPQQVSWNGNYPISTLKSDSAIRNEIRWRLFWSPFVDGKELTIEVRDGVATLTAETDSWLERQSIIESAIAAGALAIQDPLSAP